MAQLVKRPALGFGSGHDLGSWPSSWCWATQSGGSLFSFCILYPPASVPPHWCSCSVSLSLFRSFSNKYILKRETEKHSPETVFSCQCEEYIHQSGCISLGRTQAHIKHPQDSLTLLLCHNVVHRRQDHFDTVQNTTLLLRWMEGPF